MDTSCKHRVFVSYHHKGDQWHKDKLLAINSQYDLFVDGSVNTRDIDPDLPDQSTRRRIRDEFLRDTTVTIVLVGSETHHRKHVDWEIYSSMIDGAVNKRSGLIAITLDSSLDGIVAAHVKDGEKRLYPDCPESRWLDVYSRTFLEERFPTMPPRIMDNLMPDAVVSVVPWARIERDPGLLVSLIELAYRNRLRVAYDLSRPMRRHNGAPTLLG